MAERNDYSFQVDGLDEDVLRVLKFEGREGISETFEFDLELTSPDHDIDFASVVGKPAVLSIHTDDEPRLVQGLVSRFELTRNGRNLAFYRARLVPRTWVLNLNSRCQIFQDMTTEEILDHVLKEMKVPSVRFELNRSYKPRLYCVQYRESDFAFVSRLMEEEGIFYYFESTDDAEQMVISDNSSVHQPLPCGADPVLPFRQEEEGLQGTISVISFKVRQSMRTGVVTLREFDFKKPSLDLTVKKESDAETAYEYYDYPGEYPDPALGKAYAEIRLQQLRTGREIAEGESDCRAFTSGFKFELSGHPRFNGEYVLTGVTHTGVQPQAAEEEGTDESGGVTAYQNRFYAIPAAVPFRPRRRTPRPIVEGVQTAIVTGPSGSEIHTDEHGRIKVKFHWDREGPSDDKSSCWVRVSQPQTGGGMLIPRVGWEVIVEFIEGDPDRPLVTGHLYNGEEVPPYGLPDRKTVTSIQSATSPGGASVNEIRFEDADGSMEFFMNASKDMNVVVANDETWLVEANDTTDIKGNQKLTVDGSQTDVIGGNRSIEVKGNHAEKIDGSMDLKVTGDHTTAIGGSRKLDINGASEVKIDGASKETVGGSHAVSIGSSENYEVGAGWVQKARTLKQTIQATSKEMVGASKKTTVGGIYTITAAGKYGVTAATLAIKARGKIVIEGGAIEIKGSSKIELKAAGCTISLGPGGIDINAAAMVTINGALVKIN